MLSETVLCAGSRDFLQVLCFYFSRWFVLGEGLTSDNSVRSQEFCVEWPICATRKTFYDRISPVRLFRSDWCQSSCSVLSAGHAWRSGTERTRGIKETYVCLSVRNRDGGTYIYYCGIGSIWYNLDFIFLLLYFHFSSLFIYLFVIYLYNFFLCVYNF
jgi:hypothetical protein